LNSIIEELKNDKKFMSCVTHWELMPPYKGRFVPFPEEIDQRIVSTLEQKGISRLYAHQKTCYEQARQGHNVVIVTPPASGKTLSYNLPVLQTLLEDPDTKAMYMFPTKALSQDQQAELNELVLAESIGVRIFTYDGDTPSSIRISARDKGQIVITNPDMLHMGILPNHPKWIKFFKSLRFVVLDELHIYRGVFGSHLTNLIRRLKRVLSFYGANPVFICCSATIGNPLELAERILEEKAVLIDENTSSQGERHFIFYNPPLVDAVQGIRRGVILEARNLAVRFLSKKIKTIVFARSRIRTELIASYIREKLKSFYADDHGVKVASYRGGYLPNERRKIEKGLRDGDILGVVSTNALELGIDIGGLDVSILAGFPGSIASSWQQAGRAGRRKNTSLSILIASAAPMDQYLVRHPEYFFKRSPESGWVDPDNIYILTDQLKCALFELPFSEGEGFNQDVGELLNYLTENGVARHTGGKWYWSDRSYPAEGVSLRTSTSENIVIINTTAGRDKVIGEMDRPSAKMLLFDNAIYIHRGSQYVVKKLDLANKSCFVEETNVNYFTDSVVKSDIKLLHIDKEDKNSIRLIIGDILVRRAVTKFKKIKYRSHENVGFGEIHLPEEEMHTRSVIIVFDRDSKAGSALEQKSERAKGQIMANLGYLIQHVAPLFLLCDSRDLGISERVKDPSLNEPSIYVYDNYPGGSGLSEGFLINARAIFQGCYEVVSECCCREGCPSCIGPPEMNNLDDTEEDTNRKKNIQGILKEILES
jgi:DEAD/DEAH box helicase domain-containing protein